MASAIGAAALEIVNSCHDAQLIAIVVATVVIPAYVVVSVAPNPVGWTAQTIYWATDAEAKVIICEK